MVTWVPLDTNCCWVLLMATARVREKPRLSCRLGLEVEDADNARAIDASYARRSSRIDGNGARSVVEVNQRNGLVIAAEQISVRDIDQREF